MAASSFSISRKLRRLGSYDCISVDATSPAQTLLSNVILRHWSAEEDVPDDLIGVFDLVYVRFFSFFLLVDDVPGVIERLYKMLKHGGYLQWGDPDAESIWIDRASAEAKTYM